MISDDALLVGIAVVLSLMGLVVTYFIGSEVVRIVRDFFERLPDSPPPSRKRRLPSDRHGTGPLGPLPEGRDRTEQSRMAVERMIEYFESESETPLDGGKE
jgi:hypothetical protein